MYLQFPRDYIASTVAMCIYDRLHFSYIRDRVSRKYPSYVIPKREVIIEKKNLETHSTLRKWNVKLILSAIAYSRWRDLHLYVKRSYHNRAYRFKIWPDVFDRRISNRRKNCESWQSVYIYCACSYICIYYPLPYISLSQITIILSAMRLYMAFSLWLYIYIYIIIHIDTYKHLISYIYMRSTTYHTF